MNPELSFTFMSKAGNGLIVAVIIMAGQKDPQI